MHHVAPVDSLSARSARAPFKYPVRVTIAGERVVRVLSGDISTSGMFLLMADPPESGTVVQLAFEVAGKVLQFAEGEVAWARAAVSPPSGVAPGGFGDRGGFGVRFTRFLHPRASALIDYLTENVQAGTTLKPRPTPPSSRRRWSGLAALAAAVALLIAIPQGAPPPVPVVMDPSLVCRFDLSQLADKAAGPAQPSCPAPAPVVVPPPAPVVKKAVLARLPEAPRPTPVVTRTVFTAAKPASLSSTPIPSGAARLVTVSRVSGSVRVAIDAVAGGQVTSVRAFANPPRLIVDVSGIPPVQEHQVKLSDPEVLSVVATKQGKATRLTVNLARHPARVVQQGDSALITY
ncbi:MAG: PilZ domain-containing protein [Archangium sp.]|nr:PilZ domain-containing protein [Archangium sp.]